MISIKSIHHPGNLRSWDLFNHYAASLYLGVFVALSMVLLYLLSMGTEYMIYVIPALLLAMISLPFFTYVKMKNTLLEIKLDEDFCAFLSAYDILMQHKPHFEHREILTPQRNKTSVTFSYQGRIIECKLEEFNAEDRAHLLNYIQT